MDGIQRTIFKAVAFAWNRYFVWGMDLADTLSGLTSHSD